MQNKEYEESLEGMKQFMNESYIQLKAKYRAVDIPSYIDFVIHKLEEMEKKRGIENAIQKQEK